MSKRVEQLKKEALITNYPIGIEKFKIVLETMKETNGEPQTLRRAKVIANVLDNMPIFIRDGELIVGNCASRPCGLEIEADYGIWDQDEVDGLKEDGFSVRPEDEEVLQELNKTSKPRTLVDAMNEVMGDSERLLPFLRSGMILPPWRAHAAGGGGGYAMSGYGLGPGLHLLCIDYEIPLKKGLNALIAECKENIEKLRYFESDSYERGIMYRSMIISMESMIRFANRFSALANELAKKESCPERKKELLQIADTCANVPANPPRNFREAIQAFWFIFIMINPSPTASIGRFDQYMYEYFKQDIDSGAITEEEVLEYLQCLRIKDMELNRISGKENRKKNSGMAKWHNMTIGGVKPDGSDASNRLTYLVIEAAIRCKVPHHTITLRVTDSTPDEIMLKALEAIQKGLSLPAFVSDRSYIEFFTRYGLDVENARDYVMTGCLDGNIPGRSRTISLGMFIAPKTLDLFLNQGIDHRTNLRVCNPVGDLNRFESYEEFESSFKKELLYMMELAAEKNNVENIVTRDLFPDPLRSAFMQDGIKLGKDLHNRTFPFENSVAMNPVGMINLANSLYAIKELVYNKKVVTLSEMKKALDDNWAGYEDLRKQCLELPKYGNDNNRIDSVAADLYKFWEKETLKLAAAYGGHHYPTGISVTSHQPGGTLCNATPDGRYHREVLADGSVSPAQGSDLEGPTGVLRSALKIDQGAFQAMLLNMKFHPTALQTEQDIQKLSAMIRTYFANGGKHIQFNVADETEMRQAQEIPEEHKELVVRIAGYSSFFVQLSKEMQDEVIKRTSNTKV